MYVDPLVEIVGTRCEGVDDYPIFVQNAKFLLIFSVRWPQVVNGLQINLPFNSFKSARCQGKPSVSAYKPNLSYIIK